MTKRHLRISLFVAFLCSFTSCHLIGDSSSVARDRQDAQSLAAMCGTANSAGWDFVAEAKGNREETVRLIEAGHTINEPGSPFHGAYYVARSSGEARPTVFRFLKIDSGMLHYVPEGDQPYPGMKKQPNSQLIGGLVCLALLILVVVIFLLQRRLSQRHLEE